MSGKGKMTIEPPIRGPMGRISRLVGTLLAILVILMIFVFFAVRTEYARRLIEDQVHEWLGVRVTIEKARIGLPYDLVIEEMVSRNFGGGEQPWFRVQEVRMGLGVRTPWRVSVHRAVLYAAWEGRDRAEPEFLHRLVNLAMDDRDEVSRCTAGLRRQYSIRVTDSAVEWTDGRGNPVGALTGIGFQLRPVDIPEHSMHYHSLSIYQASGPGAEGLAGYKKEWLVEGDRPAIDISENDRVAEPRRPAVEPPPAEAGPDSEKRLPRPRGDRRSGDE